MDKHPENNRVFAERNGICGHPSETVSIDPNDRLYCGKCSQYIHQGRIDKLPDFAAQPWLVLEVMMKRGDWSKFLDTVGWHSGHTTLKSKHADILDQEFLVYGVETIQLHHILSRDGSLRDRAIEFMKEKSK